MNAEREIGKTVKTAVEIALHPVKSTLGILFEINKKEREKILAEKILAGKFGKRLSTEWK